MERAGSILRKSVHSFLTNYQFFTSVVALLAFPFCVSVLLSQAFVPSSSSLLPSICNRLSALFDAAGFPASSDLFTILNRKLSQTISCSFLTLPFSLTFLLITKASVIQAFNGEKHMSPPSFFSIRSIYKPLLITYICNSLFILSANATVFSILSFAFSCLEGFGIASINCILFLSAAGTVLYSIVLANAIVISNLALVLSGMERAGGYLAILKACVLIRERTPTALFLALPINLSMAAIEALFDYRVVRAFHVVKNPGCSLVLEGMFIAYMYSCLVALDTIVNILFFKSCERDVWMDEGGSSCLTDYSEEYYNGFLNQKTSDYLP